MLSWIEPVEAFQCFAATRFVTFFESRGGLSARSRYSYLCVHPTKILRDVPLESLRREISQAPNTTQLPFAGGAAGFCAYELGATLDRAPRAPGHFAGIPDMQFGIFDLLFAWDHGSHTMWLLSATHEAEQRAPDVLAQLSVPSPAPGRIYLAWAPTVSRATHLHRVAQTLNYINAGDIYQANITAAFEAPRPPGATAADIFLALRAGNPAPFTAYIDCGNGCAVASVSPERFVSLDATGRIEARPIKGTRPRSINPTQDAAEAAALLASAKDRAENLMIVDLLRNDISRVAVPGSVTVPTLCALESFPSVHHLVSVIAGQLRSGRSAIDLLSAAFPGGSITGAPKLRAMEIIAELEGRARGPYCGTAAWLGHDRAMDSSILIRTVSIAQDRIIAQAGGGIVAESDPQAEWEELLVKIMPMLKSLGHA